MDKVKVKFKKLYSDAKPFKFHSNSAAGADIYSYEDVIIPVAQGQSSVKISTGIAVEIPEGYEMQIRARSGLSSKGIIITNGVGTIDSDYRGEVKILLTNLTSIPFRISKFDRIAQAVVQKVEPTEYEEVEELSVTERGTGGFGSTGV